MFTFRKAITSEAKPLIGLYSESGCGKTKSALLLGKGFTGDMSKVGMIETESGRGEAYADDAEVGGYLVLPIREEFSPKTYGQAISAAEKAKIECLIVDSASHEWEGINGVLAQAAQNQADGKKGPLVWQQPKISHAREFMLRLTQTPIPLVVVCMRAKYTMEEIIKDGKKEWARSKDLSPKQSEDILYEMFVHGWIDKEHAFHGTKYTLDLLRKVFIDGKPITIETGQKLKAWASGAKPKESAPPESIAPSNGSAEPSAATQDGADPTAFVSADQAIELEDLTKEAGVSKEKVLQRAGVTSFGLFPIAKYLDAKKALKDRITERVKA